MTGRSRFSISKEEGRRFLTDRIRLEVDWRATPQALGEPPPPVQKPVPAGATLIPLPPRKLWQIPPCDLLEQTSLEYGHSRWIDSRPGPAG